MVLVVCVCVATEKKMGDGSYSFAGAQSITREGGGGGIERTQYA
jgi:hypothetical protein